MPIVRRLTVALLPAVVAVALWSGCALRGGIDASPETGFAPIRSELIFSANYYDAGETLTIVMRSGAVFDYHEVPKALYEQLLAAEEKDAFYRDHVQGRFGEKKVEF
jgi:hypothetical protein